MFYVEYGILQVSCCSPLMSIVPISFRERETFTFTDSAGSISSEHATTRAPLPPSPPERVNTSNFDPSSDTLGEHW